MSENKREKGERSERVHGGGARAGGISPVCRTTTILWVDWLAIARLHAREARAHAEAGDRQAELRAAMVAVTASAFALDGMYGAVKRVMDEPTPSTPCQSGEARHKQIRALFKRAFSLGPKGDAWRGDFKWLFVDLRAPGVHHGEEPYETVPHPEIEDMDVSVEHRNYSAASAERAVAFAREVVKTCLDNPKPATEEWVASRRPFAEPHLEP